MTSSQDDDSRDSSLATSPETKAVQKVGYRIRDKSWKNKSVNMVSNVDIFSPSKYGHNLFSRHWQVFCKPTSMEQLYENLMLQYNV